MVGRINAAVSDEKYETAKSIKNEKEWSWDEFQERAIDALAETTGWEVE